MIISFFYKICTWDLNHWNQLSNLLSLITKLVQWHTLIINTFRGPVFTIETPHKYILCEDMPDDVQNLNQTAHKLHVPPTGLFIIHTEYSCLHIALCHTLDLKVPYFLDH